MKYKLLGRYLFHYKWEVILGISALLVTDGLGLMIPWLIKGAIDSIPQVSSARAILPYSLAILGAAALQALFRFIWRRSLYGFSRKVEYDLRNDYFAHLQRLSCSFFQYSKTGDLMSRATNDLAAVRELLGIGTLMVVDTLVTASTCLALMGFLDLRLTLLALLPLPLISILVASSGRKIHRRFAQVQEQLAQISSLVQESLAGIRLVQAYVREKGELQRFERLNADYIRKNLQLAKSWGLFYPLLELVLGVAAAIVLWQGGKSVISGRISLGSFVAFNAYLAMLTWPMVALGYVVNLAQRGSASLGRIQEILEVEPEIVDSPDPAPLRQLAGELRFRGLSFSYPQGADGQEGHGQGGGWDQGSKGAGENPSPPLASPAFTLAEIDLRIEAGQMVAVVGPIGSGKSTLAKLILRIYEAPPHQLFLDGLDIRRIPLKTLREQVGYVDQEPFLFSDTLRENLSFGHPKAGEEEVWEAVAAAGLTEEIRRFPQGLDTLVGERGVTLSGGQKQRVALARVLLKRPRILILDDTFSSLDAQTEREILARLRDERRGLTTVLISHRLSAAQQADLIVAMDQGRIVERGGHAELLARGGLYARLYQGQQLAIELETL